MGEKKSISDVRGCPLSPSLCQGACVKASPVPPSIILAQVHKVDNPWLAVSLSL